MADLYILGVLCLIIVASEWLVQRTMLRGLGTALLVIVLTALAANLGVVPAGSPPEAPVAAYEGIFAYVAPLSIFWLLLPVRLRDVLRAGGPLIGLFLLGALGTMLGVLAGLAAVGGPEAFGDRYAEIGGMFTGTYTGGSVNFNALALNYELMRDGALYGGAVAVDNIITAVWMVVTLIVPRLWKKRWHARRGLTPDERYGTRSTAAVDDIDADAEVVNPLSLAFVLALGFGAVWVSELAAAWLAGLGVAVPSVLILTILALVLAQVPVVAEVPGAKLLGLFAVYLFLAVIGAFCDVDALRGLGSLGITLGTFAFIVVAVHGLVTFGVGRTLNADPAMAAVASQANIGGGASALALARSLGRTDLVLPAVLLGSLGTALGTFLGFWMAEWVLPFVLG